MANIIYNDLDSCSYNDLNKYRIEVEVKQTCHGFFSFGETPRPGWGKPRSMMPKARLMNASRQMTFMKDDIFYVDGVQKMYQSGESINEGFCKALKLSHLEDLPVMRSGMTAMMQVKDTHILRSLKIRKLQTDHEFRLSYLRKHSS